jgi:hypothetical protein
VFRGIIDDDSGTEWEEVNTMVKGTVMFDDLFTQQWSHVNDVADLYSANQVVLSEVYKKVRCILDGWKFKYHEPVCDYLSAYIMAMPIMMAVGNANITFGFLFDKAKR